MSGKEESILKSEGPTVKLVWVPIHEAWMAIAFFLTSTCPTHRSFDGIMQIGESVVFIPK